MEYLGEKVRHLRAELRGLSMQQLADRAGLSLSLISRIESGKIKSPSFDVMTKLADTLGCELDFFRNDEARTPLQVTNSLPEHLRQFVLNSQSVPYLVLAKEAQDKELDPPTMRKLIELLETSRSMPDKAEKE